MTSLSPSLVFFYIFALCTQLSSVVSCGWFFVTPWTTACQMFLSITNSQSPPKPMSIESVMASNRVILHHLLLLLPQSFQASVSFHMSQKFTSGGQSIGVLASKSVLPMNTHGMISFRMDWLDLLTIQCLSRVFSNTTVQKHQFFGTQLSL